jgi:hypothetical protein
MTRRIWAHGITLSGAGTPSRSKSSPPSPESLQATEAAMRRFLPFLALVLPVLAFAQVASKKTAVTLTSPITVQVQPAYFASGAPTFGGTANNVTTGSTPFCSLTSGSFYEVCCSASVTWRTGAATPTALTTDNPLYGPGCRTIGLRAADTCIALITSSGTATCSGSLRSTTP